MSKKKNNPCRDDGTRRPEKPGILFVLVPDDKTHTMILCPLEEEQRGIKLTKETAKILIAMLDHQIQEWL